ncbi:MAG: copper resistance protein B [Gemmatimonadota bacterium]|nr:copper resistance protein B [Gemmatimonadota bacterium]
MRKTAPSLACARRTAQRTFAGLAAGLVLLAAPTSLRAQVGDHAIHSLVLLDQFEQRAVRGEHPLAWDLIAWVGGDYTRAWIKSSGAHSTRGGGGESEVQVLFGRLVAPFWDAQVGAQVETRIGGGVTRTRASAVVALEGLAPYWFELEPSLYVSDRGDVSSELTASYDLYVTQRLLLQPRVDVRAAVQEVREFGVGSGLNDAAFGLRLRYEVRRELAPYVGMRWSRSMGSTAEMARAAGEATSRATAVAGLRVWF